MCVFVFAAKLGMMFFTINEFFWQTMILLLNSDDYFLNINILFWKYDISFWTYDDLLLMFGYSFVSFICWKPSIYFENMMIYFEHTMIYFGHVAFVCDTNLLSQRFYLYCSHLCVTRTCCHKPWFIAHRRSIPWVGR